jgi:hypothetical protein
MRPGRPPIIAGPEEMEQLIIAYFGSLPSTEEGREDRPPTVNGLALALGFTTRQSLADYEERPEYSYLIKRARLQIKTYWEERLGGKSPVGAIFWLKNHDGYKDAQEITGANGEALIPRNIEIRIIK